MGVLAIWRYPVKAMLGELLATVEVEEAGLRGDRRFVVVDAVTGERIANKRGPTDPRLRACRAELLDAGETDAALPLRVTLPDGTVLEGEEIEEALSELLERRVRLQAFDAGGRGRLGAPAAFHDFAPVHVLAASTLTALRASEPAHDWDPRRFRANLLLDDEPSGEPFAEDALVGRSLRGRAVALDVGFPTPRCVVPTRATEDLPRDPALLRTVVRRHRLAIEGFGSFGCLGAYAEVAAPGRLAVGDRLTVA
ncbi:MAG TPA: MOSC N-terminal beta barrel domain-containing protein [Capillimicrobium sp.]|jgi:uncharacterized protein YcbX